MIGFLVNQTRINQIDVYITSVTAINTHKPLQKQIKDKKYERLDIANPAVSNYLNTC